MKLRSRVQRRHVWHDSEERLGEIRVLCQGLYHLRCLGYNVSVKTQQCGIRNITILHKKGLDVSTLLSHLQALKGQIHSISGTMHCGIPQCIVPFLIRTILVTGKVFTHNCDTGKLSALIQC
jgi:hypothetical protein